MDKNDFNMKQEIIDIFIALVMLGGTFTFLVFTYINVIQKNELRSTLFGTATILLGSVTLAWAITKYIKFKE